MMSNISTIGFCPNKVKKENRLYYIDFLRGIASIMVIFIHLYALFQEGEEYSFIFVVSSLLADPLFFFISGFLFWKYDNPNIERNVLMRKIKRVFMYIVVYLVYYYLVQQIQNDVSFYSLFLYLIYPRKGLWYIYLLAVTELYLVCILMITRKKELSIFYMWLILFVACLLLCLIFYIIYLNYGPLLDSGYCAYYLIFFAIGVFFKPFYSLFMKNKKTLFVSALFFICCFLCIIQLIDIRILYMERTYINVFIRFILSFSLLFFTLVVCSLLNDFLWIRVVSKIGLYSLEVYFFHMLIMKIFNIMCWNYIWANCGIYKSLIILYGGCFTLSVLLRKVCYYSRRKYNELLICSCTSR